MSQQKPAVNDKYENIMDGIGAWGAYYRANPNRFVCDHWGIKLKKYQEILLCEMFDYPNVFELGSRGIAKTWLTALFASAKCTLYPGTEIVVVSATRKQAGELVGKITKQFMPNYPLFALEIENVKESQYDTIVTFRNNSYIQVATASESTRGMRGNVLIIDEARLVKKEIIDSILKKILTAPRHAGFMDLDEYADYPQEENQLFYLTSGWYASHWCCKTFKDFAAGMLLDKPFFASALPYQLAIKEKLLDRRRVEADMAETDFNEISFIMEMMAVFWEGADGCLYAYDEITPARTIKYAALPTRIANLISDKRIKIPQKLHNEVRILSADIALMQSTGKTNNNDATSVFVNSMILNDNGHRAIKNIIFTQNFEGLRVEEQALEIRRLAADYDVDYLVIDARGLGLPVVDLLMDDMYDQELGVTYCALGCCNNEDINKRCKVRGAPRKIWAMLGSADINSSCALTLREEFRQNNIRLLNSEEDFEDDFAQLTGFNKLSLDDKLKMKLPYIHTTLAINELINLQTEIKGNFVKVKEKPGFRKDRFSSLSYNIWVANQIEKDYVSNEKNKTSFTDMMVMFRKPNIQERRT